MTSSAETTGRAGRDGHGGACCWRITGTVDSAALRNALHDVVAHHESVRSPATPEFVECRLTDPDRGSRDTVAHEFLNRIESGRCPAGEQPPPLRAALGRFDDQDSVLVVEPTDHPVNDGWSLEIIIRYLARLHPAQRGFRPAGASFVPLPTVTS